MLQSKTQQLKAIVAAVLVSALVTSAIAQPAKPTKKDGAPAAKPADLGAMFRKHWDDRVALFKEENRTLKEKHPDRKNVILLGDSITEGFKVEKYFVGKPVINRGIGADIIGNALPADDHRGILRRLDNSVFDCNPSEIFLLIGINDLGSGRKPDVMEKGYREILQRIHEGAPKVKVHVQSVLPTRDKYARHNEPVRNFNERLRKLAAEFGYDYLDLHKLMIDDKGELKPEFTKEGLHLTDAAYQAWHAEVVKTMGW
jgi:lysophospholipase L1-like esterase